MAPGVRTSGEVRREHRTSELCLAAMRALSGRARLQAYADLLYEGQRRLPRFAPHLQPTVGRDSFTSLRGAADGIALRLRWSDEALHARLRPQEPGARLVFDLLEQYRVEALGQPLQGVRTNLRHRHDAWLDELDSSGLTDTLRGLLVYTIACMARSRVTGDPISPHASGRIEATRFGLAPAIGEALASLRRCRHDQAAYAPHALAIAHFAGAILDAEDTKATGGKPRPFAGRWLDALSWEPEGAPEGEGHVAESGERNDSQAAQAFYRAFTTSHDRVWRVAQLVRPAVLSEHRARLDERLQVQGVNVLRLAHDLRGALGVAVVEGFEGGEEEGWIDGSRLAQLISVPGERRVFRRERTESRLDVSVAVLVDCSGSMRAHAEWTATLVDLLVRALDMAGARTEVLGFTTSSWNGGQARADWQRAGRPPTPGRLNGLCHMVFKDAQTPWRRARASLAGLMEQHLFREGIDGEAVQWGCDRLHAGPAARRLLLVVSDGSPMDAATAQTNSPGYLDDHLREVVRREELRGAEIVGIGLGMDLTRYYRRSLVLDPDARLTNAACHELVQRMRPLTR